MGLAARTPGLSCDGQYYKNLNAARKPQPFWEPPCHLRASMRSNDGNPADDMFTLAVDMPFEHLFGKLHADSGGGSKYCGSSIIWGLSQSAGFTSTRFPLLAILGAALIGHSVACCVICKETPVSSPLEYTSTESHQRIHIAGASLLHKPLRGRRSGRQSWPTRAFGPKAAYLCELQKRALSSNHNCPLLGSHPPCYAQRTTFAIRNFDRPMLLGAFRNVVVTVDLNVRVHNCDDLATAGRDVIDHLFRLTEVTLVPCEIALAIRVLDVQPNDIVRNVVLVEFVIDLRRHEHKRGPDPVGRQPVLRLRALAARRSLCYKWLVSPSMLLCDRLDVLHVLVVPTALVLPEGKEGRHTRRPRKRRVPRGVL